MTTLEQEFHVEGSYQYDRSSPLRWIISHVLRYKIFLFAFILGVTITQTVSARIPILTGRAFDSVLTGSSETTPSQIATIALTIAGLVILRGFSDIGGQYAMEVIAKRLERDGRDELYLNLLGKSQTWHIQQRVGDLMACANNDVREINGMVMPGFSLLFDSMMGLILPIITIGLISCA